MTNAVIPITIENYRLRLIFSQLQQVFSVFPSGILIFDEYGYWSSLCLHPYRLLICSQSL